jgi:hypothetical protein
MGTEEGEEVQAKGIYNIFSKITAENFQNLKKELSVQIQEASRTPNKLDQNRTSPRHIIIKNNRHREQRKNIEVCKRERKNNI